MVDRAIPLRLAVALALVGVSAQAGAGFIVDGTVTDAQTLTSGTGVIAPAGILSVGGSAIAIAVTGSADIVNSGVVEQTGTGRALRLDRDNLTLGVVNEAGARIVSADADTFQANRSNATVSLDNRGGLRSLNASRGGAQAVDWNAISAGSNTVANRAGGLIEATAADAVRPGANGFIDNAGTIAALPVAEGAAPNRIASGSDGVDAQSRGGVQILNTGSIAGRHGITGGNDDNPFSISVTNESAGAIEGVNGSGINIDGAGSTATVVNRGSIVGRFDATRFDSGDGDGVDVDGILDLDNAGLIRGIDASGGSNPEGVSIGGGTVVNRAGARIVGEGTLDNGAKGQGLLADDSNGGSALAATQVVNSGLIRGFQGFAVKLIGDFADTLDNQAGGTLQGAGSEAAVQTGGGNDRVRNAGAIVGEGGLALDLGDGDDTLTIDGGAASIVGSVSGGAGTDALILDPGAGRAFAYQGVIGSFATAEVKSGSAALAGSIDGTLSVTAEAILAPGNSVGILDAGGLALAAAGVLAIELDPANVQGRGTNDRIRVSGAVALDLADLVVSLYSAPALGQMFDIVLNAGTDPVTGRFAQGDLVRATYASRTYRFAIDYAADADGSGTGNDVRLTAVPAPGSPWLLGLGVLGLALGGVRAAGGSPFSGNGLSAASGFPLPACET